MGFKTLKHLTGKFKNTGFVCNNFKIDQIVAMLTAEELKGVEYVFDFYPSLTFDCCWGHIGFYGLQKA